MIEHAKVHGIVGTAHVEPAWRVDLDKDITKLFWEAVEKCQPFIFEADGGATEEPPEQAELKLDAPFEVFSIEMVEGRCIMSPRPDDMPKVWVDCMLCVEIAPKSYIYYILARTVRYFADKTVVFASTVFDSTAKAFIERINTEAAGTENVRCKIKVGRGKDKHYQIFRRVIHIQPKKPRSGEPSQNKRMIDWQHRWSVRGHWRKYNGKDHGKDRSGERCVEGM